MRFILLLWAIPTAFVASAPNRYLPHWILAHPSQLHRGTDLPISTTIASSLTLNLRSLPKPAPIYLVNDLGKVSVHSGSETTAQPLDESANDDLWSLHARKGNSLMCAMRGSDVGAGWQAGDTRVPPSAASKWANFNDMVDWYWWEAGHDPDLCDMATHWGMRSTFQGLQTSPRSKTAGGNLQCFQIRHQNEKARYPDGKDRHALAQSYMVDGHMYHATNAEHFFAMDVRAGVIVGVVLIGPQYAAERLWGWTPAEEQLPKLRNLSDIYWLYWQSLSNSAGTRIENLRTYIVYAIHNAATIQIIARSLRSRGKEAYESWPGQYFTADSPQGLALLGSPVGATIGFFLMQHKQKLGNKYVSGVRVLRNDGTEYDTHEEVDLVFHITDVPLEMQITDEPMDIDGPQNRVEAHALATAASPILVPRIASGSSVEEYLLGPNHMLRVHKTIVSSTH